MTKKWHNENNEFQELDLETLKSLEDSDKYEYAQAKELNLKSKLEDLVSKNENLSNEMIAQKEAFETELKTLKSDLQALAEKKEKETKENKKNMNDQELLIKEIENNSEKITQFLDHKSEKNSLTLKAVSTQTTSYTYNSAGKHITNIGYEGVLSPLRRDLTLLDVIDRRGTNKETLTWDEQELYEGSFAMTAEGAVKPLISRKFKSGTSSAKKIAGRVRFTEETLKDFNEFSSIILGELKPDHDILLEDAIFSGDGTGLNHKGILEYVTAWVALPSFDAKIYEPSIRDVANNGIAQILSASQMKYRPNLIMLNVEDYYAYKSQKDNTGNPLLGDDDYSTLAGVRVIPNVLIPQGNMLIMDSTKARLRDYEPFFTRTNYSGTDFEENKVTTIGESRTIFYIAEQEKIAFVYADITTAIASLKLP